MPPEILTHSATLASLTVLENIFSGINALPLVIKSGQKNPVDNPEPIGYLLISYTF